MLALSEVEMMNFCCNDLAWDFLLADFRKSFSLLR